MRHPLLRNLADLYITLSSPAFALFIAFHFAWAFLHGGEVVIHVDDFGEADWELPIVFGMMLLSGLGLWWDLPEELRDAKARWTAWWTTHRKPPPG